MATKLNRLPVFLGQANSHLYHYAGNNPVKYVDPEGKIVKLRWASEEEKKNLLSAINSVSKYLILPIQNHMKLQYKMLLYNKIFLSE